MIDMIVSQIANGLVLGFVYVLIAVGLSITFGLLGVINFAHGAFFALGAYFAWQLFHWFGWAAVIFAPPLVGLVGMAVEATIIRRLYGKEPLLSLIVTFALALLIEAVIRFTWGADGKPFNAPAIFSGIVEFGPLLITKYRVAVLGATIATLLGLWAFLAWTPYGRILRAGSRDPEMVELLGINLPRVFDRRLRPRLRAGGDGGRAGGALVGGVAVDVGQRRDARLRGGGDRRSRLVPRRGRRRSRGRRGDLVDHPVQTRGGRRLHVRADVRNHVAASARPVRRALGAFRMTTLSTKIKRLWSHPIVVATVVLVAASSVALAIGMPIQRVTQIAIYALYGAGVNFLIGYLGLVPFGASFFFGCASYAVAILGGMVSGGNEIVSVAIATVFSVFLALVVGAVILRRRGLYFSLLTLACSQIAFEIAFKWTAVDRR